MLGVALHGRSAAAKIAKQQANYQDAPKDDKRCADCLFFIDGGSCKLVEGEISPEGWCQLFRAKPA